MSNTEQIPARLSARPKEAGVLLVEIAGDWLDRSSLPGISAVEEKLSGDGVKALEFDANALGRWDSALMVRILDISDLCAKAKVEFRAKNLPDGLAKLIAMSLAVPEKKDAARKEVKTPFLQRVGQSGVKIWTGGKEMLSFMGESVVALLNMVRGRAQFRWSDIWMVIQQCGPEALGIVALINFLIGMILAFVGATELTQFGASIYTADLVAIATVREMACIMTGIIICGRTGAAFAAQLGTMKVNQEIEAFQTFGISPFEFLVLPRMVALILMMPLLCLFANLISILGGFMVSSLMLDVSPVLYLDRTIHSISLFSFSIGVFKGGFFGVIVALTGCLRGMQCGTNAAAVGQATTSAVVTGITWIIASDGIFAVICSALHL
jgi:phospholipid/cholesterol/gamma-HCH transport system permease protein